MTKLPDLRIEDLLEHAPDYAATTLAVLDERASIVRAAVADVRLAGGELSGEARQILDSWAAGTMSLEDLEAWKQQRIERVKARVRGER